MLRDGENYVEKGIEHYEEKFRLQRIKWLRKEARSLNQDLDHPQKSRPMISSRQLLLMANLFQVSEFQQPLLRTDAFCKSEGQNRFRFWIQNRKLQGGTPIVDH
jgi:hypothetical protein